MSPGPARGRRETIGIGPLPFLLPYDTFERSAALVHHGVRTRGALRVLCLLKERDLRRAKRSFTGTVMIISLSLYYETSFVLS